MQNYCNIVQDAELNVTLLRKRKKNPFFNYQPSIMSEDMTKKMFLGTTCNDIRFPVCPGGRGIFSCVERKYLGCNGDIIVI